MGKQWNKKLTTVETFRMGEDAQDGRICTVERCPKMMERAKKFCDYSVQTTASRGAVLGAVVPPTVGDAVMMYNQDAHGVQTVSAIHGSCGVQQGTKVVLAKFIRAGAKPFHDEALFTQALKA